VQARANLDQLRHQAKDLLRAARAGDSSALKRILAVGTRLSLASAQLALARENGFESWAKLKAEVERRMAARAKRAPLHDVAAGYGQGYVAGDPSSHQTANFGGVFDEEFGTDREIEYHRGVCQGCGAKYEFEATILRGFADHIEAFCPICKTSLGTFREDVGVNISVRIVEARAQ
jgi:hypothetical protein